MQKIKNLFRNYWFLAGVLIFGKLILHLLTNTNYELHRDEMLFFNQGDHLAWGNATVPPMIGFVSFLIKSVFGYSVFGIRLIPAILGTLSVYLIARIVHELGGGIPALLIACLVFILSPGFLIFDTLYTVNVFDQFFWLLISYLFFKLILTGNVKLWLWIGLLSGLAFLNKYLVVYLLVGFFIAIIITPKRTIFFTKYFVFAVVLGFVIILPNIIWQYNHNWPIIFHISELKESQMVNMTYRNYLADMFYLNGISTLIWFFGLISVLFFKTERKFRFIGIASVSVILLFMFSSGKAYYNMGIIPILYALGAYTLEKYYRGVFRIFAISVVAASFLFSLISLPFGLPVMSFGKLSHYSERTGKFAFYPFLRWEDGKIHPVTQVYSDMTGWKELVSLVNTAYQQLPADERKNCTIYAERNYGYAGAVHFYGKSYHLPDAITFLDSYVLWAPDTIAKGPVIYINYDIAGLDKLFGKCTVIGTVTNIYFRENGLKVFLCREPNDNLQPVYKQKAEEEKKVYCKHHI